MTKDRRAHGNMACPNVEGFRYKYKYQNTSRFAMFANEHPNGACTCMVVVVPGGGGGAVNDIYLSIGELYPKC